jgi:hypothetical protein
MYMNGVHLYKRNISYGREDPRIGADRTGRPWLGHDAGHDEFRTFRLRRVRRGEKGPRKPPRLRQDDQAPRPAPRQTIPSSPRSSVAFTARWRRAGLVLPDRLAPGKRQTIRFSPAAASESKVFGTELVQRVADFAIRDHWGSRADRALSWAPHNGAMAESYQESSGRRDLCRLQRDSTQYHCLGRTRAAETQGTGIREAPYGIVFHLGTEHAERHGGEILAAECTCEHVKKIEETDAGYDPELWRKVAELGWTACRSRARTEALTERSWT